MEYISVMLNIPKRSTIGLLAAGMAIGQMTPVDDGSLYKDPRDDGFGIAMGATGPMVSSHDIQGQNQITGELLTMPVAEVKPLTNTNPTSGSVLSS